MTARAKTAFHYQVANLRRIGYRPETTDNCDGLLEKTEIVKARRKLF